MKNAKRIISMLLVLVMTLGLLAGCKKKEETKVDEGDRTLTVGIPQSSNIPDYDTNAFSLYLESACNVDIEWDYFARNGANYQRQLTLRCTGEEDLPDVILLKMSHYLYNQFGEDGYIMDLKPLIDKYGKNFKQQLTLLDEEYQQFIWDKGTNTVTGGFYSMPLVCGVFVDNLQTLAYINQDWLNKVNKKVPTNTTELYDVLKAWKAYGDLNGNGEDDELLMIGDGIRQVIHNAYVENVGTNWNVKNGKLWDPLKTQEFRDSVIFLNKLTREGLVDKLSFTINGNAEYKQLVSPPDAPTKVGIWTGHYATRSNPAGDHLKDFVAWAPLDNKTGKGGYTIYSPHMVDWGGMISAECKKPQLAMEFLDVFYLDETVARMRHGEKDVDWTYGEGENLQGTTSFVNVVPGHEQAWFDGNLNACLDNFLGVMVPENYLPVTENKDPAKMTVHGREGNRLYKEFWSILQNGKHQEEPIGDLFYTPEEYDVREAKAGNMGSYAADEVINFIANEKDPNVKANWDEYYKKLDQLGRAELEKIAQAAYTRKMSDK